MTLYGWSIAPLTSFRNRNAAVGPVLIPREEQHNRQGPKNAKAGAPFVLAVGWRGIVAVDHFRRCHRAAVAVGEPAQVNMSPVVVVVQRAQRTAAARLILFLGIDVEHDAGLDNGVAVPIP